jgi:glycerophosphoryl diester phosphodiesterase
LTRDWRGLKAMKNLILCLLLLISYTAVAQTSRVVEIEGHRGARGLVPENTIPSFLKALEYNVETVELDLAVSADGKLVVSHEPWFSHVISLDKNGRPIAEDKEKEHNIYRMKYSEIKLYDVGRSGNRGFPEQQKMKVVKPLLKDVFKAVNDYAKKNKLKPVRFNIEIKSKPEWDNSFTPVPAVFAKMVYEEIVKHKLEKQVIVQSFDVRPLQELRRLPAKLPIALLVMNKDGVEKNIAGLGFEPDTYSPHFSLVDEATVKYCRARSIKIVPWTVNEISDLERMKKFDLDGIITDYPDRAVKVFRN